jgi:hypothetical protein
MFFSDRFCFFSFFQFFTGIEVIKRGEGRWIGRRSDGKRSPPAKGKRERKIDRGKILGQL